MANTNGARQRHPKTKPIRRGKPVTFFVPAPNLKEYEDIKARARAADVSMSALIIRSLAVAAPALLAEAVEA